MSQKTELFADNTQFHGNHGISWKNELFTDDAQFHGKWLGREIVNYVGS